MFVDSNLLIYFYLKLAEIIMKQPANIKIRKKNTNISQIFTFLLNPKNKNQKKSLCHNKNDKYSMNGIKKMNND